MNYKIQLAVRLACLSLAIAAAPTGRAFSITSPMSNDDPIFWPSTVITNAGQPALRLKLPPKTEVKTEGDRTNLRAPDAHLYVQLWVLPQAKTIAEGKGQFPALLAAQDVKNFKPTATNVLTVAGAPATQFIGPGVEVDDGDPSTAEVILFTVGGKVFAACVHGEHREPAESAAMLQVLQAAQAPAAEAPPAPAPAK